MDDADREREQRRIERDKRRREQGKESYFDGWAVLQDPSEQPTMVIRRDDLEAQQFSTQETAVIPPAQQAEARGTVAARPGAATPLRISEIFSSTSGIRPMASVTTSSDTPVTWSASRMRVVSPGSPARSPRTAGS